MVGLIDRRERLIARARQGFRLAYGTEPTHFFAAPGRVNLIGEHVDYNGGYVLPCAIDREAIVALGPSTADAKHPIFEAVAIDMGIARDRFALDEPIALGDNNWQNHVRGVVDTMLRQEHRLKPARIAIAGDVPIGAGLSSSAAFGVAVALACSEHSGLSLAPESLARIAQIAENDFVGCACGIMDQMASACATQGNALLLDCQTLQHMPIGFHPSLAMTVIDTGLRRNLTESAFNQRREECETAAHHYGVASLRDLDVDALERERAGLDPVLYSRARHVVAEIARVEPFAVALTTGDAAALSDLMTEAHQSLSGDFAVSLPPIDRLAGLVAEALGPAGGVRLTGAGFGGCLVALTQHDAVAAINDAIALYNSTADLRARIESFKPSAGAGPIIIG